jgi:hypothetical protein
MRVHAQAARAACGIALLGAALVGSGCGRDPIRNAIDRLDGAPAEAQKAAMELRLMSRDPVPQLEAAVLSRRTKSRARLQCIAILGAIARGQNNDPVFAFLRQQLHAQDPAVRDAAIKAFVGAYYEAAVPDLIALKKGADKVLLKSIDAALLTTTQHLAFMIGRRWNSPASALAEYDRAERLGLGRGMVGYSKAKYLDARGQTAAADAQYRQLGVIRRWWVCGPFPNRQTMGFRHVYPPEKEINLKAEYTDGYGKATWFEVDRDLSEGELNFENYYVDTRDVVAYALVFVISDRERPVEFRAGSDDTLTIILNNETVWANEMYRGCHYDDDIADATLRKGVNTALFKVCQDWGSWVLLARITGPGDTPLEGVTITTTPPPPFSR